MVIHTCICCCPVAAASCIAVSPVCTVAYNPKDHKLEGFEDLSIAGEDTASLEQLLAEGSDVPLASEVLVFFFNGYGGGDGEHAKHWQFAAAHVFIKSPTASVVQRTWGAVVPALANFGFNVKVR